MISGEKEIKSKLTITRAIITGKLMEVSNFESFVISIDGSEDGRPGSLENKMTFTLSTQFFPLII